MDVRVCLKLVAVQSNILSISLLCEEDSCAVFNDRCLLLLSLVRVLNRKKASPLSPQERNFIAKAKKKYMDKVELYFKCVDHSAVRHGLKITSSVKKTANCGH